MYADWDAAYEAIDEILIDWDTIMSEAIDSTWENWLQQFMNQFMPNCILQSRHNLPWLTNSSHWLP